jgi:hypothetical protein
MGILTALILTLCVSLAVNTSDAQSKKEDIVQSKERGSKITSTAMGTTSSFSVSNSDGDTLLFVTDDGLVSTSPRVGLGTTNPKRALDVSGRFPSIQFTNSEPSTSSSLYFFENSTQLGNITMNMSGTSINPNLLSFRTSGDIRFIHGSNVRFSFKNNGDFVVHGGYLHVDATNNRVGIGTSTPSVKLDVRGIDAIMELSGSTSDKEGLALQVDYANGQTSSRTFFRETNDNLYGMSLIYAGSNNPTFDGTAFTLSNNRFYIMRHNNSAAGIVAMTIVRDNGNVGIGTTSPGAKLQVGENGDGTVALANSHDTFSDRRYKENIRPMENVLDLTRAIEGVRFNWKKNGKSSIGFIAQDIEEVLPEIVDTDEAGYKSVDYSRVVAVLVEAVKEQQKIIEQQKSAIAATKITMDDTIRDFNQLRAQMAQFELGLQKVQPVKVATANTATNK